MKNHKENRTRIIGIRFSNQEYTQIEKKWKASTCRKLSEYIRRFLLDKTIVTTYRNRSLDDYMSESMKLRSELSSIGNNINQAVKKLHTLDQMAEFKNWIRSFEEAYKNANLKMAEIKSLIQKIAEQWLR